MPVALSSLPAEPVDAVYLWVSDADPAFRETLTRQARAEGVVDGDAIGARRFRDHGELRYSLRSLEMHAPWIRHVHIVTNGQIPGWLDTSNPRVSVVPHAAIFPDPRHLPTFNSRAIEVHLPRIPNLSPRFLYLNDDMFLGNHVRPEDFLTPSGGQRFYLERWGLPSDPRRGPTHERAWAYTQRFLDRAYGRRRDRAVLAHVPQLYDRSRLLEIERRWRAAVRRTSSHRFRAPDDVALRILYCYSLLEGPDGGGRHEVTTAPDDYCFARLESAGPMLAWWFDRIARLRPRFFCLNDDRPDDRPGDPVPLQMKVFLTWYFRHPSSFERAESRLSVP